MENHNIISENNTTNLSDRHVHRRSKNGNDIQRDNNYTILKAVNISKVYESPAGDTIILRNINFSIKKGEFVSIVGPSGSGKSTLLNIIGALDRPTSGRIYLKNVDIFSLSDRKIAKMRNQMIGFIFQSYNLINRTTVLANVEIPAIIAGMDGNEITKRALNLLKILGIKDKASVKPLNLSGGQQQRVAIARALMNNPAMILADEPTGNLDTKTGDDVFKLLKMISSKYNRTIVMVTHNPDYAEETDKTIYVRDGKIEKEITN
ncbi:ABC transporter ATP-binding protein [soil metagenome]